MSHQPVQEVFAPPPRERKTRIDIADPRIQLPDRVSVAEDSFDCMRPTARERVEGQVVSIGERVSIGGFAAPNRSPGNGSSSYPFTSSERSSA